MATTIPTVTEYAGDKPDPTQTQPTFNQNMSDELDYLNALPEELNSSIEAMNTVGQECEDNRDDAVNAALESVGATNFSGNWSDATGAATAPSSYLHNSSMWVLVVDVSDITATEPSTSNSDWYLLPSGEQQETNTANIATNTSRLAENYGWGFNQAVNVSDSDSNPTTWLEGSRMGVARFISTTTGGHPEDGQVIITRYQTASTSSFRIILLGTSGGMYHRRWTGSSWDEWYTILDSNNTGEVELYNGAAQATSLTLSDDSANYSKLRVYPRWSTGGSEFNEPPQVIDVSDVPSSATGTDYWTISQVNGVGSSTDYIVIRVTALSGTTLTIDSTSSGWTADGIYKVVGIK